MNILKAKELFFKGYFSTCNRSDKTITAYTFDIAQFIDFVGGELKLSAITSENIELWLNNLKLKNYAPASIQRKSRSLKVFFNYWVRKDIISRSPFFLLKLSFGLNRNLPKILNFEEMSNLLTYASKIYSQYSNNLIRSLGRPFIALRNLTLIELMFSTGLRVGEVAKLKLSDYCPLEKYFIVKGKGNKQRVAYITGTHFHDILTIYLESRKYVLPDIPFLFVNIFNNKLSEQGISLVINKYAKKSNISNKVTPHMIRHTVATQLLKNGADLRVVQEFLGHSSIITTQRYTHISKEYLAESLNIYHPTLKIVL